MTIRIDRRSFIVTGTFGVGAFAVPGFAQTANVTSAQGFTHVVASGEPAQDSMLLWTRYVPASGDSAHLRAEISEAADFAKVVAEGAQVTGPWRDWTAKVTLDGLRPGTTYYYRFVAPDGSFSPVGTTRTLPAGPVSSFKVAVFSCSNLPFGYFNAYAHAAERGDIDLAVHLGDYFYEYAGGDYLAPKAQVPGRVPDPHNEIIHITDYRVR